MANAVHVKLSRVAGRTISGYEFPHGVWLDHPLDCLGYLLVCG